jgi:hypothetical protein
MMMAKNWRLMVNEDKAKKYNDEELLVARVASGKIGGE